MHSSGIGLVAFSPSWWEQEQQLISEVMGLRDVWRNNKVLIVMGTSLGLIHWGWYSLKTNPLLHKTRQDFIPEPGIVAFVSPPAAAVPPLPPPAAPPAAAKTK